MTLTIQPLGPRAHDLTGRSFGKLVAIAPVGKMKGGNISWLCICECGTESVSGSHTLLGGKAKSCGCSRRTKTVHGHASGGKLTSTYNAWIGMLQRCRNTNDKDYANYGGRGISVCEAWSDFTQFLSDMREAPAGTSLDRIDVNGDYTPKNCRWATARQQSNNKRNNVYYAFRGQRLTAAQWARRLGMQRGTLEKRLTYYGWSVEKALTTPVRRSASA